ncbi:MAG: alcohol dehydrogenase, partial [Gammaproteobacteria bacterium]|nr:alcohol dehydrogenase [Gammaproteobacteria bacterium]
QSLTSWSKQMDLPGLSALGVKKVDIAKIVEHSRGSSMLTNPVKLTDDEIRQILFSRLDRS